MEGLLSDKSGSDEKRQLQVRLNRLESSLFDLNDKVDQVMEGIEEDFCGLAGELEPALKDLDVQFEVDELEPFAGPFLKQEYLRLTKTSYEDVP